MTETEMPAKKLLLGGRKILIVLCGDALNSKGWKVGPGVERASNSGPVVCHSQTPKFTIDAKPACGRRSLLVGVLASHLGDITREQTRNAIVAIIGYTVNST
jgi:hypothetical protein